MHEINQILEYVKSHTWKKELLKLISNTEEIQKVSKEINNSILSKPPSRYQSQKNSIFDRYKREELIAACQYYNNSHLIGFWRWYNREVDKLIISGKINGEFPVFSISKGHFPETTIIKPHNIKFFQNFTYHKDPNKPNTYNYSKNNGNTYQRISNEQLIGQLHLLNDIIKQSTIFLYNEFIFEQSSSFSSYYDDYKIHKFIDRILYCMPDGQYYGAPFEAIFFSNNLNELEVYLNHCANNKYELRCNEISEFLNRQRKYYMSLATNISIEESAFLNNNRHLLYYDPDNELVIMPGLSIKQHEHLHNELVLSAGMIKMDGCPFAKSKGVSKNAVIEVFSRFDELALKIIEYQIINNGK